ncbi:HET-domain-containing protein [Dendrothele bispora CBS 962.96]|uniref:HET-domain-containing protein n=1 Tax=Dendrothele bispora (strain CBS 962.96) TaxID=1314807 RepID=A0A4S8LSF0_DENBC|nr:HET-domain-containing protein [Dendrothele bispora CBS 962.96]
MESQEPFSEIKNLVCDYCWDTVFSTESFRTICTTSAEQAYTTRPWIESAQKCNFCRLLRQDLLAGTNKPFSLSAPEEAFVVHLRFMRDDKGLELRMHTPTSLVRHGYIVCAAEDDVSALHIITREVVPPKNTNLCFFHALKCIKDCARHDKCPELVPAVLPTRVLDCSDPAQVRLVISDPAAREYYTTLSYVWGEDQPYRTTAGNINVYSTLIEERFIPKTVQDAIIVTHELGIRYLWVDSFCIMQDLDEDKAQEIAKIRAYYSQSFLTIVAVGTEHVSDGFLHEHPKWSRNPILLPFRCPDGPIGSMRLYKQFEEVLPHKATEARAWCLEERILSPRCLLFCSHAVQYECLTTHTNINGSSMWLWSNFPMKLPVVATVPVSDPSELNKASWNRILADYTLCKLTKSKDKLVAFAGIAEFFHGLWPESRYVAGLWTHLFPEALLWTTIEGVAQTRYRAPSWSWAAIDGEIGASIIIQARRVLCDVKRCENGLKWEGNLYSEVTSGLLVIETGIMPAIWNTVRFQSIRSKVVIFSVLINFRKSEKSKEK